jgi:hypothetical protein
MSIVVKSLVIGLTHYRERYNQNVPIRNGVTYEVRNEIVYWYKNVGGQESCLSLNEADQLMQFINNFPNIFDLDNITTLACDDMTIQWDITVHPIPLNQFVIEIPLCNLPFEVLGRRALVL